MDIVVFGAGCVGSFFGGILSKKYDVILYGRKEYMDAIAKNGLKITGKTDEILHPKTCYNINDLKKSPIVLLTVKSHNTETAVKEMLPLIDKETLIVSIQNGVDNVEKIRRVVGKNGKILAGITSHGITRIDHRHIFHAGIGETVVGDVIKGGSDEAYRIAEMFKSVDIDCRVSKNICSEIWLKAIINAAINPITAITGLKNGYLIEIPYLTRIMERVCMEAIHVARAAGIVLPDCNIVEKTKEVVRKTAENKSSMLQDIEKGRPTEIDSINGAIADIGRSMGIDTPLNTLLTALIKGMEEERRFASSSPQLSAAARTFPI